MQGAALRRLFPRLRDERRRGIKGEKVCRSLLRHTGLSLSSIFREEPKYSPPHTHKGTGFIPHDKAGGTIKAIQSEAGHADTRPTLDIYAHCTPEALSDLNVKMNDALNRIAAGS